MDQQQIKLYERKEGPAVVPTALLSHAEDYRAAVINCWKLRKNRNMTQAMVAAETGMRPSHLSSYLAKSPVDEKGRKHRNMPGEYVTGFQRAVGNTFITQWQAMQDQLTILEETIADRKANV